MLLLVLDKKEELKELSSEDDIMKKIEEKITLSKDSAMILCYDEEEHKENMRRAVTKTEIEEGKAQGIKEGKAQGIKEVASKLIKENIDINIISSTTGLSIDELKKLENEK